MSSTSAAHAADGSSSGLPLPPHRPPAHDAGRPVDDMRRTVFPRSLRLPRAMSAVIVVLGLVIAGVGITTYAITASQLQAQHVTVAAVSADAPGRLAGKPVGDPLTALAQINAIKHHSMTATGGKTYGELGNVATSDGKTYNKDVTAATSTDGKAHQAGQALSSADARTYAARSTAQQASFLEASLYVSVLAFGLSALIIGLGLVVALTGITLRLSMRPATTA